MIAGTRLRAGKAGSGKGAARMIAQAVATARAAGVSGQILVRGDSAYGTGVVVAACRRAGAHTPTSRSPATEPVPRQSIGGFRLSSTAPNLARLQWGATEAARRLRTRHRLGRHALRPEPARHSAGQGFR